MIFGLSTWGQGTDTNRVTPVRVDLAVTYNAERANLAPSNCGCFWLNGASMEASIRYPHGFGLAASVSGAHIANAAPGIDINRIVYLTGGRYTHALAADPKANPARKLDFFGQLLFGAAHGFGGAYPAAGGVTATANSFAMQAGGGLNMPVTRRLGLRLLDAEYLFTALPNNASNEQNDLRLGAGLTYRLGK
jgi:hypothetical protein